MSFEKQKNQFLNEVYFQQYIQPKNAIRNEYQQFDSNYRTPIRPFHIAQQSHLGQLQKGDKKEKQSMENSSNYEMNLNFNINFHLKCPKVGNNSFKINLK